MVSRILAITGGEFFFLHNSNISSFDVLAKRSDHLKNFSLLCFSLEIEGSGKIWRQDQRVRLRHVDTRGYLHSHDKKYTRIAGGQQEVRIK